MILRSACGLLLAAAAFSDIVVRVGARRAGDPFTVLVAVGRKP